MKKLMTLLVLSCYKATFLIEKSYDTPLSFFEKLQLGIHLKICDKCAGYQKQSFLIERVIKTNRQPNSNPSNFKLSNRSKTRIQRAMEENSKKM
jgi:hypothetical protein